MGFGQCSMFSHGNRKFWHRVRDFRCHMFAVHTASPRSSHPRHPDLPISTFNFSISPTPQIWQIKVYFENPMLLGHNQHALTPHNQHDLIPRSQHDLIPRSQHDLIPRNQHHLITHNQHGLPANGVDSPRENGV